MSNPTAPAAHLDQATVTIKVGPFLEQLGNALGSGLYDHLIDPENPRISDVVANAVHVALVANQVPEGTANAVVQA